MVTNHMAERLKRDLKDVEYEEERLRKELDYLSTKKQQILTELSKYTDTRYEEDMLALVYEQRKQDHQKK